MMNKQTISKALKAGIFAGILGGIIEMIISSAMTKYLGQNVDTVALLFGGATIALTTLVITTIISGVIAARKQNLQRF